jgi:hypothetical protein
MSAGRLTSARAVATRCASVVSSLRREEAPIDEDRIEGGESDETAHNELVVAHSFVVENEPWASGEQPLDFDLVSHLGTKLFCEPLAQQYLVVIARGQICADVR